MTHWIAYSALGFLILEGMLCLLFPQAVKDMILEVDPAVIAIMGFIESLLGAAFLYIALVS